MKVDMHCHTAEGSVDGKITMEQYIEKLKERGFGGMLVTDHDTYGGYQYYMDHIKGKKHQDFVVFKGMEYDTADYGHIIVIMPEDTAVRVLELRGLKLKKLIKIVHYYGGILGPAHPCGEPFMSFYNTKFRLRLEKHNILKQFDFIEVYNACEPQKSNSSAKRLARVYQKPGLGGSDAHSIGCAGMGYTVIPDYIKTESSLIEYIKATPRIMYGGNRYHFTTKDKLGKWHKGLVVSFYVYNKTAAFFRLPQRVKELNKIALEMSRNKSYADYQMQEKEKLCKKASGL